MAYYHVINLTERAAMRDVRLRAALATLEILGETDMGTISRVNAARFHSIVDQFRTLVYDVEGI